MDKKVLVAVDDSPACRHALDYACRMRAELPGLRLTLLHVQPAISIFLVEEAERDPASRAQLKRIAERNAESARDLLERTRERLVRAGFPPTDLATVSRPRRLGLSKDILDQAQEGLFDAIVVGRRGTSALEGFFAGSVSAGLIANARLIPTWLVDGEVRSTRILAAVDGSEASFKAVDHLAFMLNGNPQAALTFFHATPRLAEFCEIDFAREPAGEIEEVVLRGDKRCMDDFYAIALKKLSEAGVAGDRIEIRTEATLIGVGKSILEAARTGGFGTLVLGRRGMNKSFFSGSVSNLVVQRLREAALWLIP